MFNKKLKAKVSYLEAFEQSVCKVIDGYFKHNEEPKLKYSTDCAVDRLYHFVISVDSRLKNLEDEIVSKNKEIENLKSEIDSDNDELANKDEKIDELKSVIKAQQKEIETLAKAKGGKK